MHNDRKITILGLGNILLEDEGFGVHFVRYIESRYRFADNVKIVDGGTLGYRLLDVVCEPDHLILIDAIKLDDEPGSIYRFNREEMELHMPPPTSAHEVELLDVLCQADLMGELPEATFLCIVPRSYGSMVLRMTETMKGAFQCMERLLLQELKALGVGWEEVC
ncbi:MAG TPA: HyaD/HybD family hydrogenase maturation endopeptidase [Deltaproteobacteria bacterium]|jgi:hydrogenase maturation protease|nr:HyaD/HybD family hydrogenase maturation endopeptidase [Deltaproteobacteria bacterium]HOI08635.1 HyaD/HybD family hydrogenase maturation endopeptidase [Deltaproteobacteria bacterium]